MVRFKNRYLLLQWKFPSLEVGHRVLKDASPRYVLGLLKEMIIGYHGDYGLACVQHSLNVKYLNVSTMVLIVRCPRAYYRAVWTSISGVTSYDGEPCSLALLHIGGTIRSCQKALIRYNTRVLREAVISSGDDMVKRRISENLMKKILRRDLHPIPP